MQHVTPNHPEGSCAWCGGEVGLWRGKPKKYCSKAHAKRYDYYKRKSSAPECSVEGCSKPQIARGLCGDCYSRAHRSDEANHYSKHCSICGEKYSTPYRGSTTCSSVCAATVAGRANASKYAKSCNLCGVTFTGAGDYCCDGCSQSASAARWRGNWTPMRKAFEAQDGQAMIAAIEQYVDKTSEGCWQWTRRFNGGYPQQRIGKKSYLVHRLSLEAKMGAPLGGQAAHHICANSKCVNPDHLQPVTHRENIAEMLARNAYLTRIAELESALAEVDPGNPLLRTVPVM